MFRLRSVRAKLLALVGVCLVPTLAVSLALSDVLDREQRADALARVSTAEAAFGTELRDDIANLKVAAQLLSSDPDVTREVGTVDRALLGQHIDDFTLVYPAMRVLLTSPSGELLASTDPVFQKGKLALPWVSFEGVTRLVRPDGTPDPFFSYVVIRPIKAGDAPVGLALASFPLDATYLANTRDKTGLALLLRRGGVPLASTLDGTGADSEVSLARTLPAGERRIVPGPGGATLALQAFAPPELRPLEVVASLDVTPLVRVVARNRRDRLLMLGLVGVLALGVALALARRMTRRVDALARVLPGVAEHRYEHVELFGNRRAKNRSRNESASGPQGWSASSPIESPRESSDELETLSIVYNQMIDSLSAHERWRSALGCYLSPAAQQAVERGDVRLGGSTMPATVLFSDIRGFTSLSEHLAPEKVLELLNRYFTEMVEAVTAHGGTVDKYIGDCLMAVWGPPQPGPRDALDAVQAGIAMRERLELLNAELERQGLPRLRTGIGIHSGPVVAGNMGAAGKNGVGARMEYTVIGDTVNLASRLEALTKELHVDFVISETTYGYVKDEVAVEALAQATVRGRTQPIGIFRVLGRVAPEVRAAS